MLCIMCIWNDIVYIILELKYNFLVTMVTFNNPNLYLMKMENLHTFYASVIYIKIGWSGSIIRFFDARQCVIMQFSIKDIIQIILNLRLLLHLLKFFGDTRNNNRLHFFICFMLFSKYKINFIPFTVFYLLEYISNFINSVFNHIALKMVGKISSEFHWVFIISLMLEH